MVHVFIYVLVVCCVWVIYNVYRVRCELFVFDFNELTVFQDSVFEFNNELFFRINQLCPEVYLFQDFLNIPCLLLTNRFKHDSFQDIRISDILCIMVEIHSTLILNHPELLHQTSSYVILSVLLCFNLTIPAKCFHFVVFQRFVKHPFVDKVHNISPSVHVADC